MADVIDVVESPSKGGGSVSLLTGADHKLVLHYRPFRINVYAGKNDLVVSLNSHQLMKIDVRRPRQDCVRIAAAGTQRLQVIPIPISFSKITINRLNTWVEQ
jgi:hypothetical protein